MGASLTWPVFCVDNGIAMTPELGVVGDLRLTADLERAVVLDSGFGWAPAGGRGQGGELSPYCRGSRPPRPVDPPGPPGVQAPGGHAPEFGPLPPPRRPPGGGGG